MTNENLTKEAIRQIAFETTGQRDNFYWREMRTGKLTASNFGKAIVAMNNCHPINIQRLREDIYCPKDLSNVTAIKWGVEHEHKAIDAYIKKTQAIAKPTGVWLFPNGVMGASPDGLIFDSAHTRDPVGITEVKCPYSLREVKINCEAEWHTRLKYLDCENQLKASHAYYHQIQGTMYAVDVRWCDFIIWTPNDMRIIRIGRDPAWGQRNLAKLEDFYKEHLRRSEDKLMDLDSTINEDDDDDDIDFHPFEEPSRDLNTILHPIGGASQELRYFMIQALHYHIARLIYECLSSSRSGLSWSGAVGKYWDNAVDSICESCLRRLFNELWTKTAKPQTRREVADITSEISGEEYTWGSLLFDPEFAQVIRTRVKSYEPFYATKQPACICRIYPTSIRKPHAYRYASEPVQNSPEPKLLTI